MKKVTKEQAETAIRDILSYIGEDPDREGLIETPNRIVRMWSEIFRGYDRAEKPKITTFTNTEHISGIVFDKGTYYSMCEHHMLPFFGQYYFAYIPKENGRILGLSKIARVVSYCSAKLQLQERLAKEVVEMLNDALNGEVRGFAILMRGQHMCKSMRGVKCQGEMTATYFTGEFNTNKDLKNEFYQLTNTH